MIYITHMYIFVLYKQHTYVYSQRNRYQWIIRYKMMSEELQRLRFLFKRILVVLMSTVRICLKRKWRENEVVNRTSHQIFICNWIPFRVPASPFQIQLLHFLMLSSWVQNISSKSCFLYFKSGLFIARLYYLYDL